MGHFAVVFVLGDEADETQIKRARNRGGIKKIGFILKNISYTTTILFSVVGSLGFELEKGVLFIFYFYEVEEDSRKCREMVNICGGDKEKEKKRSCREEKNRDVGEFGQRWFL